MLYLVQTISSGAAQPPRMFLDKAQAKAVYVELAKQCWPLSYSQYCELNGQEPDSFESAQAFSRTFDAGDKNQLYFWQLTPEDLGVGSLCSLAAQPEAIQQRRSQVLRSSEEVAKSSQTLQTELQGLLDKIDGLATQIHGLEALFGDAAAQAQPGALAATTAAEQPPVAQPSAEQPSPAEPMPVDFSQSFPAATPSWIPSPSVAAARSDDEVIDEEPIELDEKFQTAEWKKFVQTLQNMFGGSRGEFKLFTRHDWRQAVYSNLTSLEYWDWAAAKIDRAIETAKTAGYAVEEIPHKELYCFVAPDGERSEKEYDIEDMAWCAAGIHARGRKK